MFKVGDKVKYIVPNGQIGGIEVGKIYEVELVVGDGFGGGDLLKVVGNKHLYYTGRFEKVASPFKGNKYATVG